jgi:hypothetical protein
MRGEAVVARSDRARLDVSDRGRTSSSLDRQSRASTVTFVRRHGPHRRSRPRRHPRGPVPRSRARGHGRLDTHHVRGSRLAPACPRPRLTQTSRTNNPQTTQPPPPPTRAQAGAADEQVGSSSRASPVATYNARLDHRRNHEGRNAQPIDKPHPAASSVPAGGTDEDVHEEDAPCSLDSPS